MTLHNSLDFKDYILSTANYFNIPSNMIEKDYYVTLILQRLSRCIPGLMFKVGTCLSKCFGIIDRFSEDIDLLL